MKALHSLILVATLAGATALPARTPEADSPRGPGHGRGGHVPAGFRIVRTLDADKNGALSATEVANASAALKTLDADNDGTLSAAELRPSRPGRPSRSAQTSADAASRPRDDAGRENRQRPVDPVMLALDADTDGALSDSELANAATSLKTLDANSDGQITRDELRPRRPAKN